MNLDFNVLVFLTGFIFALPIIGYLFRFNIPISIFFLLAGTFMIAIFLATDGIIEAYVSTSSTTQNFEFAEIYNVNSSTGSGQRISNNTADGAVIRAEYFTNMSSFLGLSFDCMEVHIRKVGAPTGNATIGVFDVSGNTKLQVGVQDVSLLLTTTFQQFTYCLPENSQYMIVAEDRVGIKYDGSNLSANRIDTLASNVDIDGLNSVNTRFKPDTLTWVDMTLSDLTMRLTLDSNSSIETITFEPIITDFTFTGENFQLKVIMIFISVMFLVGGALVEVKQR